MDHPAEPIRIPTGGSQIGHKKVPPLYVLSSSPNQPQSENTSTSTRPVEYQFPISVGYPRHVSPRVLSIQDQIIQQNQYYKQRTVSSLSSTNKHAVLPAIGSNIPAADNVLRSQIIPTPGVLREQTYITQPTQPRTALLSPNPSYNHSHTPGPTLSGHKMNIMIQNPHSARQPGHTVPYEMSSKPVVPSIQQQRVSDTSYRNCDHSSCQECGRNMNNMTHVLEQRHQQYHNDLSLQQQMQYRQNHHVQDHQENQQNYNTRHSVEQHESTNHSVSHQHLPLLQVTGDDQSYVQRWLINPNHPYMIAPAASHKPPQQENSNHTQQQLNLPSHPSQNYQRQLSQVSDSKPSKPANSTSITVVLPKQTDSASTAKRHRSKDIPIRYLEPPTHQVVNRSGKLLTPEDALKRTLKGKKMPPLTKRNSLRSIFSDASSNLEKIAEELDEEIMKLPASDPVDTTDITFNFDNSDEVVIQ